MGKTKRNPLARELEEDRYRRRIREHKKRPTPQVEEWAWNDEDGVFYWEDNPHDENMEPI